MRYLPVISGLLIALLEISCTPAGTCPSDMQATANDNYLIVKPNGGFANRMRALASASVIAKRAKRTLAVDWIAAPPDMVVPNFSDIFESGVETMESLCLPNDILADGDNIGKFGISTYNAWDLAQMYGLPKKIEADTARYVYLQSGSSVFPLDGDLDEIVAEYSAFYRQLVLIPAIRKKIEDFTNKNFKGHTVIGVHVRSFSTGAADDGFGKGTPKLDLFKEILDDTMKKNGQVKFFVASDSLDLVAQLDNNYAGRVITYPIPKVDRDTVEGVLDAVTQWYILGATDYIVGTFQSSFSDEAAFLTKEKRKIGVGPLIYKENLTTYCFDRDGYVVRKNEVGGEQICLTYSRQ